MSLTSYRAAPPRDKPLRAFSSKNRNGFGHAEAPIPSGGFLRRQPGPKPLGCERYVPTPMRFGKGRERSFRGFMIVKTRYFPRQTPRESALARSSAKAQLWGQETALKRKAMEQSLGVARMGQCRHSGAMPTGPRKARPDDRLASNPESRDSGSGANAPSRNDEIWIASPLPPSLVELRRTSCSSQ
jgi:hypothetical protein